jgi:hypothetical protein
MPGGSPAPGAIRSSRPDNLSPKPQVDILVPNGEIVNQQRLSPGRGFEADVSVRTELLVPQQWPGRVARRGLRGGRLTPCLRRHRGTRRRLPAGTRGTVGGRHWDDRPPSSISGATGGFTGSPIPACSPDLPLPA